MDGKTAVHRIGTSFAWLIIACMLLIGQTGCLGFAAQLIHTIRGNKVDAEYNDLEEKRVAVVTVSSASSYGPDVASQKITEGLRMKLAQEKVKANFVRQSEIESWMDGNWEDIDYVELGRAVKADRVIAIDLEGYSLREGSTLFKGRATYTVSVYDIENGQQKVFARGPKDFEFPVSHGTPTTSLSERQFEQYFIHELAGDVARYFYDFEFTDTVARDAAHFSQ